MESRTPTAAFIIGWQSGRKGGGGVAQVAEVGGQKPSAAG